MKSKKIISTLLSLTLLLSAVGCAPSGEDGTSSIDALRVKYDGTHIFNVVATEKDFVKDGKTDYKILVSPSASTLVANAVTEFRYFFEEATGIKLDVVYDNGNMTHTSAQKYISIGETQLYKAVGIEQYVYPTNIVVNNRWS